MAPRSDQDPVEVVDDNDPSLQEDGIDAEKEDRQTETANAQSQAANELEDLNQDNIIDDSPGVSTRGVKNDAMAQEKEIDGDVAEASKIDEQS